MTDRPIACTLSGSDAAARFAAIAALNLDALRTTRQSGLTLELDYDASAHDRVREFVRLEQACCAFLDFEISEIPNHVRVRITAPKEAGVGAEALFQQFAAGAMAASPCGCR